MTREFGLDLHQVLFDATNFFTYIGSFNERSQLARRGHSKEGRKSLRIVGVALLVTADSRLPLLHRRPIPANRPDAPLFQSLAATWRGAAATRSPTGPSRSTLVFDKGNNSRENLDWVERAPFHFIGSLVPTHHPDLLAVEDAQLRCRRRRAARRARLPQASAWKVFGVRRTVLVTWNQKLFDAQRKTLLREIDKRRAHLRALQRQLRRWRDARSAAGASPGWRARRRRSTAGCEPATWATCSRSRSARKTACRR